LGDRMGRRNLVLLCLAGTGLCSLGTAFSANPIQFTVWRVLTGLFAAAVVPNLVTLSSEIAPRRLRATFATITVCGAQGGTLIGAAMQAFILPRYGWSGALFLGAALSVLILPIAVPWLAESPRFMEATAQRPAAGGRDRVAVLLGEGRR